MSRAPLLALSHRVTSSLPGNLRVGWAKGLPSALRVFCLVYIAGLIASLVVSAGARAVGLPESCWNPLSDPLMGDLMEYPATFQLLHSAAFFDNGLPRALPTAMFSGFAYPPFAAVVLAPLYRTPVPVWIFLSVALCWLGAVFSWVRRALLHAGLAHSFAVFFPLLLALSSFPVQRLVHQGNIELLVWVFVAAGTYAFVKERHEVAAGLWGMAAAMKLYPFLLLILLVPKRQYRACLLGCTTFFSLSWLSLWWLGPTTAAALRGCTRGVLGYHQLRTAEWSLREVVANHSAFTLVKLCAHIAHVPSPKLVVPYYLCGAGVFLWVFFGRLARLPVPNQLLAVTVCMLVAPAISYYHTLVHLYAPLLLLTFVAIEAKRVGVKIAGLQGTLLLFIPLCMPYTLVAFPRLFAFWGLVQLAALSSLFLCALQYPFPLPRRSLQAAV